MSARTFYRAALPTWNSMPNDYLSEMEHFTKPWLAIFGEVDTVVPTSQSVRNIQSLMAVSGNTDCAIVVLPRVGHAPVEVDTKRMVRIDNIVLNWLDAHLIRR
jgi:pimeloyl-ACP methyl ester carboxylesterase